MTRTFPKGRPEGAGWPPNEKPTHKTHFEAPERDSFGRAQPACKHVGGFHVQPLLTKCKADITCVRCKRLARVS